MAERAYRFIAVGGKTFYFNIYQTHGGTHNYLTIVAKKGDDQEKLTMFPNQMGSFLHCLLETYAELCRRDGVASPWEAGERVKEVPSVAVAATEGVPREISDFHCPQCDTIVYDPDSSIMGMLEVIKGGNGQTVWVKCGCGWVPESPNVNSQGYATFHTESPEGAQWLERLSWR